MEEHPLAWPHLEYCISAWSPYYAKDEELLKKLLRRFTRMLTELRGKIIMKD